MSGQGCPGYTSTRQSYVDRALVLWDRSSEECKKCVFASLRSNDIDGVIRDTHVERRPGRRVIVRLAGRVVGGKNILFALLFATLKNLCPRALGRCVFFAFDDQLQDLMILEIIGEFRQRLGQAWMLRPEKID